MDSGVNVYDETWLTLTVSSKTYKLFEKHFHKLLLKTLALTVLESAFFVVWCNILLSIWLNTQFVQFKNTYNKKRGVFSHYFRDCYGFTLFKEDR